MSNVLPLTKARKNFSELVNQAYYEGRIFGVSKGNKPMGIFIGAREWKEIISVIEANAPGLADTFAIMADPELQQVLVKDDEHIRNGNAIPWEHVLHDSEETRAA